MTKKSESRTLDIDIPKDAREFLAKAMTEVLGRKIEWFNLEDGRRVPIGDLTDSQAVSFASSFRCSRRSFQTERTSTCFTELCPISYNFKVTGGRNGKED